MQALQKAIAFPLSILYYLCFGFNLLLFHAVQWVCFYGFGYNAHKKSVDVMNFFLLRCLNLLGTRISFDNPHVLEKNQSYIIVANHQGMFDIPPLIWYLRKIHPKFISKKELGKGIPGVSFNLKHGGSVLINRKNPKQALEAITSFAKTLQSKGRSAVIFPEGTRSRTHQPKKFQTRGLITLIEHMPNAIILPVTINHSWKLMRWGSFPMGIGVHMKFKVHTPLKVSKHSPEDLISETEKKVVSAIES